MIRLLAPIAMIVGLAIGVWFPGTVSSHTTGATLAVALTPPTLVSGSEAWLNCGWHVNCNNSNPGNGLDWDDEDTLYNKPWYFRGFFYVSDTSRTAFRMYPLVYAEGPGAVCDVMTVWIVEIHSGALMAIPTYTHVNITNSSSFDWSGSQWTTYQNRQIGVTIDENNSSCSSGSHVHEDDIPTVPGLALAPISRNTSLYPAWAQCNTVHCEKHWNNSINHWTRSWQWSEGVGSH